MAINFSSIECSSSSSSWSVYPFAIAMYAVDHWSTGQASTAMYAVAKRIHGMRTQGRLLAKRIRAGSHAQGAKTGMHGAMTIGTNAVHEGSN